MSASFSTGLIGGNFVIGDNRIISISPSSGTNTAGQNLTIHSGQGTGTQPGGSIIFQTAPGGSSGSSANDLATKLTVTVEGIQVAGTGSMSDTLSLTKSSGTGLSVTKDATIGGNLTVTGNLTVSGTSTTINTATLDVEDINITLARGNTTPANANGGGITLKAGSDKTILYDQSQDRWTSNIDWNIASGKVFKINGSSVLSSTALGSTVVGSSLTSVGTLSSLTVSGDTTFDTSTLKVDSSNNRIGIGTTSPGDKLHVQGGSILVYKNSSSGTDTDMATHAQGANIYMDINNYTSNSSSNGIIWKTRYSNNSSYTKTSAGIYFQPEGNYFRGGLVFYTNGTTDSTTDATERMRIDKDGNVGIGDTSPSYKLDVSGTGRFTGALTANVTGNLTGSVLTASQTGITGLGTITTGTWNATAIAVAKGGTGATSASAARTALGVDAAGTVNYTLPTASSTTKGGFKVGSGLSMSGEVLSSSGSSEWTTSGSDIYYTSGKVGIGTTSPDTPFTVVGNPDTLELNRSGKSGKVIFQTPYTSNDVGLAILTGGSTPTERMRISATNGNIGIGTSSPDNFKLHIYDNTGTNTTGSNTWHNHLCIEETSTAGSGITFKAGTNTGYIYYGSSSGSPWAGSGSFGFATTATANSSDLKMVIKNDGNVGIGTTSPSTLLVVGEDGGGNHTTIPGIHMKSLVNNPKCFVVGQSASRNVFLTYYANSTAGNGYAALSCYGGSNDLVIQRDGGNVGIGDSTPSYTLDVNGTGRFTGDLTAGANLTITGNLTVSGTTTTVNSTTVTVDDPIITLGGDTAPGSDDNKDRGVEFRYYDESAKVGFMGWDDSDGSFVVLKDATNSSEVFSGTAAELKVGSLTIGSDTVSNLSSLLTTSSALSSLSNVATTTPSTYQALAWNGSAWAPGGSISVSYLVNNLSSGSGIWFDYANTMRFITNSTEKMIIKPDGKVGIGTTSPGAKLEIYDNTTGNSSTLILRRDVTTYGSSNDGPVIEFKTKYTSNNSVQGAAKIRSVDETTNGYHGGLAFDTNFGYSESAPDGKNDYRERMRISYNGNVGIGTATPQAKLDVVGSAVFKSVDATNTGGILLMPDDQGSTTNGNSSGRIFFNETQNSINNYGFSLGFNGGDDDAILNWKANTFNINRHDNSVDGSTVLTILRTNGNVGIGTTSPNSALEINGTTSIGPSDGGAGFLLNLGVTGTVKGGSSNYRAGYLYGDGSKNIILLNQEDGMIRIGSGNSSNGITVDTDNKVGIGTTTPGDKLEVKGGAENMGAIKISSYSTTNKTFELRIRDDTTSSYPLHIGPMSTFNGININNSNGNVGIGIANPGEKLEINDGNVKINNTNEDIRGILIKNASYDRTFYMAGESWGSGPTLHYLHIGYTTDSTISNTSYTNGSVLTVRGDGRVGIETTSPGSVLDVNGKVTCTDFQNTSDRRIKENIIQANDVDVMDKINNLNLKVYTYTEEYRKSIPEGELSTSPVFGWIAQEVKDTYSDAVVVQKNTIGDTEYEDFHYIKKGKLYDLAVAGVKILHKKNKDLETKVASLESELAAIKAHLGL